MKYTSRDKILESPKNDKKLIATSEHFHNLWYEINGRAICVHMIINGKQIRVPGSMADMRQFANELLDVISVYGDL